MVLLPTPPVFAGHFRQLSLNSGSQNSGQIKSTRARRRDTARRCARARALNTAAVSSYCTVHRGYSTVDLCLPLPPPTLSGRNIIRYEGFSLAG